MDVRSASASDSYSAPSQVPLEVYPPQLLTPAGLPPGTPAPVLEETDATKSRSLNGVQVTGEEIDDLFKLYYAPSLYLPRFSMAL